MTARLSPETEVLLERIRLARMPHFSDLAPQEARRLRAQMARMFAGAPFAGSVHDRSIELGDRSLDARIYEPEECRDGTMVYLHGGGWVVGNLDSHDGLCRGLAEASGLRVLSVDYRLAPEHPHPAALEDAWEATQWASEEWTGPIVVGGDSAGGHLATIVAARSRGGEVAISAQLLIYPVTDLSSLDTESYREFAEGYLLEAEDMRWFRTHYLPDGIDVFDPDVSPLHRSDLSGMPPAVFVTAECDVLVDEAQAYAERLRQAGNRVDYRCYEGVVHGFMALPGSMPQATSAIREAAAALVEVLESGR
jgi:acetyl esterase